MYYSHPLYVEDIKKISAYTFPWEKLENKKILITGASGMIGTVLVDVLMEHNRTYDSKIHVFAMGRSEQRARERFKNYMEDLNFSFIQGDINNSLQLDTKMDYLFHCASNTHPRSYAEDPIGTIMTNVAGTENVLKMAVYSKAERVVFLSSVEIYGENRGDVERFSEEYCGYIDCNTLRAGYPEGKRTGEALCQAYRQKYGLDVVIPRVCRVFGPTMLQSDSKALAQFIKKAVNREDIVLKSEGNQYFSYCYVTDVVSALLYILFYGKDGEAYNIADEKYDIRLKELAGILADYAGRKVVFELPDEIERKGYSKASDARLDAKKLNQLGWKSKNEMKEQLEKTIEIIRSKTE